MKICKNCGFENKNLAFHCKNCGNRLTKDNVLKGGPFNDLSKEQQKKALRDSDFVSVGSSSSYIDTNSIYFKTLPLYYRFFTMTQIVTELLAFFVTIISSFFLAQIGIYIGVILLIISWVSFLMVLPMKKFIIAQLITLPVVSMFVMGIFYGIRSGFLQQTFRFR